VLDVVTLDGVVRDASSDGEGGVMLLLEDEPWLMHATADGNQTPIRVRSNLSWATRAWAAPDGSFVALGTNSDPPESVQFQRFDAAGEFIGSGSWGLDTATWLAGVALLPDSRLAILASTGTKLAIGTLATEDTVEPLATLDFLNADPFGMGNSGRPIPTDFKVGPTGEFFLAGDYETVIIDGVWMASLDPAGTPLRESIDERFNLSSSKPLVAASAAGTYAAWTSYSPHMASNTGTYATFVSRLSPVLEPVWQLMSDDDVKNFTANALLALPDGAVVVGTSLDTPALTRFNRDGLARTLAVGLRTTPAHAVSVGDHQIVVVENPELGASDQRFRMLRLRLEPLQLETKGASGPCATDAECESALCCRQGTAASGMCGEASGCEFAMACTQNSDCAGAVCLAGVGVCTQTCEASTECPASAHCATRCVGQDCQQVCLPECLAEGDTGCAALGTWTCEASTNAEGVDVSICL
jgi:hypothetical protein